MSEPAATLRVVTYNIHKCRGLDRRYSVERIASVLRDVDADILCLQEVVHARSGPAALDQAHGLARELPGYDWVFGTNRPLHGGEYGNMTLSRLPLLTSTNHDITRPGREARGVLQTDIQLPTGARLHIFNAHLGTGFMERRFQAQLLVSSRVLGAPHLAAGSRLVLGDFNEWTSGLTTQLLRQSFASFQPRHALRLPRTFPGVLPLLTLDHCFYEAPLNLASTHLLRTPTALVASDHLPLVAEFTIA